MVVFAPYPVGETRVQREAEALVRHGYAVDVIALRLEGEPETDCYKGVQVFRMPYREPKTKEETNSLRAKFVEYIRFFFSAGGTLNRLHRQHPYQSIQVHNLPDFLVFSALIPRLKGVPVLLDLHDLMPEFYAGRFGTNKTLVGRLILLQERLSTRFASHVITVSEHWRQSLIQRGVAPGKCSVVMNVADESIFHPAERAEPRSHAEGCLRLIYHGSIPDRYGLDLAVQAVHRLRGEIPGIHLLLIGDGNQMDYLKKMVAELDLERHVTFDSLHLAEELPGIILSCDLGIVPYRNDVFTDGLLPTKLMEYAALEFPAVASRTSGIQEYFEDTNVALFEPDNVDDIVRVIREIYYDPQGLETLARGSRNFNERYNWAKVSEDYVALVSRLGDEARHGKGSRGYEGRPNAG